MNRGRLLIFSLIILSVIVLFTLSGCLGSSSPGNPSSTPTTQVTKPRPRVESVSAATSGMLDKYYAVLDITVKNEGADGTILVIGTITQGGQTETNDLPLYITRNSTQVVKLVLPLRWNGGDWTADAQVQVP